jgi:hypothetical protein
VPGRASVGLLPTDALRSLHKDMIMTNRTDSSDAGRVEEIFRRLVGPEDERDEAAAEAILELHGVDPSALDDELRGRLEREVEGRRARGEEVPQGILAAIDSLRSKLK